MENWQIRFIERPERLGREMIIFRKTGDGMEILIFPQDVEVRTFKRGEAIPTAGMFLDSDLFQALVDAVHKDFKPSEGKYTEGKMEGTERHLGDLRKLLKLND